MWGGGSEFESPGGMSGDVGLGDFGLGAPAVWGTWVSGCAWL